MKGPGLSTYYAAGYSRSKVKRIAYRYYPLTNLEIFRTANWYCRQVLFFNLQNGKITGRVGANEFSLIGIFAMNYLQPVSIGNHVVIGNDVTIGRKNDS